MNKENLWYCEQGDSFYSTDTSDPTQNLVEIVQSGKANDNANDNARDERWMRIEWEVGWIRVPISTVFINIFRLFNHFETFFITFTTFRFDQYFL